MKMWNNSKKLIILFTLIISLMFLFYYTCCPFLTQVRASDTILQEEIKEVANGILSWKRNKIGSINDKNLINNEFIKKAGTTDGDWFPLGMGRLSNVAGITIPDDNLTTGDTGGFLGYLANMNSIVTEKYKTNNKLHKIKATEWHRISLAILAVGGNPRQFGEDGSIDLISDGTYNRKDSNGKGILGLQGINGIIWGLISLDSGKFNITGESVYTRDDIIRNLLARQLSDGGWALTGKKSDVDITAMAIQALAPYYNSEKDYIYKNKQIKPDGSEVVKKVRQAIDEAINWLSEVQKEDGDFSSWDTDNCESTAQVIVALCSLGVDIFSDSRFITKSGKTLYDGILKYRLSDGGFIHSTTYDAENPTSKPDESNSMASDQVLYCLASVLRQRTGMRKLYDMRKEQTKDIKSLIKNVSDAIDKLGETSSKEQVQKVYDQYGKIEEWEREYVYNYKKLSQLVKANNIPYIKEEMQFGQENIEDSKLVYEFTALDKQRADNLPDEISTKYKTVVVQLLYKLNSSMDFDEKQAYKIKLEKAKNQIEAIEKEVSLIKAEIKEKLYPFSWISLDKRQMVHQLNDRYEALTEYDKTLFEPSDVEGLKKCKTQVDNLQTALIIGASCLVVVIVTTVWVILNIRKRRKAKKLKEMPESEE